MLSNIWRAAIALAGVLVLAPAAWAAPARCISDAELEAAVGPQIESGAFAVNAAALGERPMCSGLTIAQAIQRLRERYVPPAAPPAPLPDEPARHPPPAAAGAYGTIPGMGPGMAPGMAIVLRYVGRHGFEAIEGRTFLQQPAVISALTRAGVTPPVRRSLDRYAVASQIADWNGIVIADGCVPHHCDTDHYRLFVNPRSGVAALCLFRVSQARWYSPISPGAPIAAPRMCPEDPADAPSAIRSALDVAAVPGVAGYGGHAYGPGSPAEPAASAGRAVPSGDITRFLRFEDASYCHSDAVMKIFADADDNGWAAIGPLGRVDFARSRDDEWTVLEAPVDAAWNGLRIAAFVFTFEPESDVLSRRILFRDRPEKVGPVLKRLGFGLSRGERVAGGDDAMELTIAITPEAGGTALDCSQ